MRYEPDPKADIVLVTQAQFERLWDGLLPNYRFGAPEDHPLTKEGYQSLWSAEIGAWVRVSPHAVHAAEQWERAEHAMMEIAIEAAKAPGLSPLRQAEYELLGALLAFLGHP